MLDVSIDEKGNAQKTFIKLDERVFEEISLSITKLTSEEELVEQIGELDLNEKHMYKLMLTGKKSFEFNISKLFKLINRENILKIKDETKMGYDLDSILLENNLKSFFVREIKEKSYNRRS